MTTRLRAAIAAKDRNKIDLNLSALEGRIKELSKALFAARNVMGQLREVEMDEDFTAENLKAVSDAVDRADGAVKSFVAQYDEGKTLQNDGEAAADKVDDRASRALAEMAGLEGEMDDAKDQLKALFTKSDATHSRAANAAEARDKTALAKAQKDHAALGIGAALFLHEGLLKRVKAFGDKAKEMPADLQVKMKDGVKDILIKNTGVNVYVEQLTKDVQNVKNLTVATIDLDKAARTLSLDQKGKDALKKLFEQAPAKWNDGLEQIGSKLQPPQKGKAMRAKLESAGVL